ncbi:MAG: ribonuclease D [Holosporaceae bacterium]
MYINTCYDDLPTSVEGKALAIDTETMGLETGRDRLCVVQVTAGTGQVHLVQIRKSKAPAPYLKRVLQDPKIVKIFHFARFDMAALADAFGVMPKPVFCTKIASKLARTYTDRHGLRELCREQLMVDLSKAEQSSDWGRDVLTEDQKKYAARDVVYLHALKDKLEALLRREDRFALAQQCFDALPMRVALDLANFKADIFQHA